MVIDDWELSDLPNEDKEKFDSLIPPAVVKKKVERKKKRQTSRISMRGRMSLPTPMFYIRMCNFCKKTFDARSKQSRHCCRECRRADYFFRTLVTMGRIEANVR